MFAVTPPPPTVRLDAGPRSAQPSAPTRPDTDTVVRPDERVDPETGDGDHDRFTHYVGKKALEKAKRKGTAVTALCGKKWRPDGDPSRYPMCPTCSDIAAEMLTRGLS
jgi:hypothetical protein